MPPELIFILVLIVFSILENALKGKKKKGGPLERPPGTQLPPGWPPPREERPAGRGQAGTGQGEGGASKTIPAKGERASEMVPEELWEEIAALARGDVDETLRRRRARARAEAEKARRQGAARSRTATTAPAPPAPVAKPAPPSVEEEAEEVSVGGGGTVFPGAEIPDAPAATRSRAPRSREPRSREGYHAQRLAKAEKPAKAGKGRTKGRAQPRPPSQPAAGAVSRRTPLRDSQQRAATVAGHHPRPGFAGPRALRQAIIAREVLGRPLALREYGEEEMWSE